MTASGILALTRSPMLFKSAATSASKRTAAQFTGEDSRGSLASADPQANVSSFCKETEQGKLFDWWATEVSKM